MTSTESGSKRCPACDADEVYHRTTQANGGHGPLLLRGLGRFLKPAMVDVHVCARCGYMCLFADEEARQRLKDKPPWKKVR